MTRTARRTFKHTARHEKGTQDPARTLKLGSGSCRDLAVLMIAALRSLGIAARFVSGYLRLADDDDDDCLTGGNTHAWVQVYVPGPGWVDFDPSSGIVGNQDLVRVAVVREPREAIPAAGHVDRDRVRPSRHEGRGQGRRGGGRGCRTWPTCWRWHDDGSLRRLRRLYKSVAAWPKNGTFSRLILCRYPAGSACPG
jgi:transglutaminase-like putative cysteine protease